MAGPSPHVPYLLLGLVGASQLRGRAGGAEGYQAKVLATECTDHPHLMIHLISEFNNSQTEDGNL